MALQRVDLVEVEEVEPMRMNEEEEAEGRASTAR